MHLVIVTREDPPLPLARLRGRGQLTELRADDLRFTHAEAAEFLNGVMGLTLSADDIALLETRTEGWIAGLQLAALSMQRRENISAVLSSSFAGDHRYVADYLVEEVLQRQPEGVRRFLLQTYSRSALWPAMRQGHRTEGSSGAAGNLGARQPVRRSARRQAPVVPLSPPLRGRPARASDRETLVRCLTYTGERASGTSKTTCVQRRSVTRSPLRTWERAAGLIELAARHGPNLPIRSWLSWVKALPDELVRSRPVLSVGFAWALLRRADGGRRGEVARRRRALDGERWQGERPEAPSAPMVVVDEEEFRSLPVTIASARAYKAGALGDVPGSVNYARRALDCLPADDHFWRGAAGALLGLAYWTIGDLEAAYRSYAVGMASLRTSGDITQSNSGAFILADIRTAQGRLREVARLYEQALHLAAGKGGVMLPGTADLYVGMSEMRREQGDSESAVRYLLKKERNWARTTDWRTTGIAGTLLWHESKRPKETWSARWSFWTRQSACTSRVPTLYVRPVAALKARVWVGQGRLAEALQWAAGLSFDDELSYLREFKHITLARVLIAQYKSDRVDSAICQAMSLLERLLSAAEEGGRKGSVIENPGAAGTRSSGAR